MSSYSIYRGQAARGIGEAPDVAIPQGEQFLASAPELWNVSGLTDGIRSWMTLDARAEDNAALGETLEAWSSFPVEAGERGFRMAVCLAAAGYYDRRRAYFAHGRAWPREEVSSGNDPALLLGNRAAFVGPWREEQPGFNEPPIAPDVFGWRAAVEGPERGFATNLIAYLYQARVSQNQIVLAVPAREFFSGSPLYPMIAFALAALPWELKHESRIRIYTSRPSFFLQNLKADLVAIPEELSADAMRVSPDAALLDRSGKLHAAMGDTGRQIEKYLKYAEAVVDRFLDSPPTTFAPAIFMFTQNVIHAVDLDPKSPPPSGAMESVANYYDLVATQNDAEQADKLLRFLFRQANRNTKFEQPWSTMLPAALEATIPPQMLIDIARGVAETKDALELREVLRGMARRRGILFDLPADATPEQALELYHAKLIPGESAAERVRQMTADSLFRELRTERMPSLVGMMGERELPAHWLQELPRQAAPALVAETLFAVVSAHGKPERSPWNFPFYHALNETLTQGLALPALAEKLAASPLPLSWDGYLIVAEVIHRASPDHARKRIDHVSSFTDPEFQRAVFRQLGDPRFSCLRDFRIPELWDTNLADLWLSAPEETLRGFTAQRLVRLLVRVREMPQAARVVLDKLMGAEAKRIGNLLESNETASAIVRRSTVDATMALADAHLWLQWRLKSTLGKLELRLCAKAWILAQLEIGADVHFEDWKQVMLDLKPGWAEGEVSAIQRQTSNSRWPAIKFMLTEQLTDLIELGGSDWKSLAAVAGLLGVGYEAVEKRANVPFGLLQYIARRGEGLPPAWSFADMRAFLANAGAQSAEARVRVANAVLDRAKQGDPGGLGLAVDTAVLLEPVFASRLGGLLTTTDLTRPVLAQINDMIGGVPQTTIVWNPPQEMRRVPQEYMRVGYAEIAHWLSPAARAAGAFSDAVEALALGSDQRQHWTALARHEAREDPLGQVLALLREMEPAQQARFGEHSWKLFARLIAEQPSFLYMDRRGRVPALEVAAFLRNKQSIGAVAVGILQAAGYHGGNDPSAWWQAFFDTVGDCPRRPDFTLWERPDSGLLFVVNFATRYYRETNTWPKSGNLSRALASLKEEHDERTMYSTEEYPVQVQDRLP